MNAALGAATLTSVYRLRRLRSHVRHRRRRDAGARGRLPRDRRHRAVLAGVAARRERRAARLDRRRVLFEGRSGREHSGRARRSVLHAARWSTADQDTKSAAGFAHGEWHLTDTVDLVTGLRYTWEERQYVGGTTDLNPIGFSCLLSPTCTPGFVGPFALTFVDDDDRRHATGRGASGSSTSRSESQLLYATISRGTKSGGFFSGISTDEPAARAVRAGRADRVRGRLQARLRQLHT